LAGPSGKSKPDARPVLRLDKWLWHARFFKSRGLATEQILKGRIRLNGQKMRKPGHAVGEGDALTFPMGDQMCSIRILGIGVRRGPATEARSLYLDLDPPSDLDATATTLE
jgi:ribosome-associated heat shock protein Hsp15